jgi:hypothetical protein
MKTKSVVIKLAPYGFELIDGPQGMEVEFPPTI